MATIFKSSVLGLQSLHGKISSKWLALKQTLNKSTRAHTGHIYQLPEVFLLGHFPFCLAPWCRLDFVRQLQVLPIANWHPTSNRLAMFPLAVHGEWGSFTAHRLQPETFRNSNTNSHM
eukprot:6136654-Amphidinium_carterae.1